jgi:hypothetical protein
VTSGVFTVSRTLSTPENPSGPIAACSRGRDRTCAASWGTNVHGLTSSTITTHLWAWNDSRLLRVRIDGGDGLTAELRLTDPGHGNPVTVTEREVPGWPSGEGRVSAGQEWRDQTMHVYQVAGLMPLEFTRLADADHNDRDTSPRS